MHIKKVYIIIRVITFTHSYIIQYLRNQDLKFKQSSAVPPVGQYEMSVIQADMMKIRASNYLSIGTGKVHMTIELDE